MAYDTRILNVATYRDASREGEVKGREDKNAYHMYEPEHESLQGVSSYYANTLTCLPCDPGYVVA